jgi:glycine hydroxymethyltransferase
MKYLKKTDREIAKLIKAEEKRQAETLMLIPSENLASKAVEEAVGSVLANKYAEGYPFRRYYQGQENVDQIESLAMSRAKKLFGVPYVNVQPYSGSPANSAVYFALLNQGEKIMGLNLAHGGHLTHGSPVSFSGKYFQALNYPLTKEGKIDYDFVENLALKEKPRLIIAGITAYPLRVDWKRFGKIADEIGAYLMVDISHLSGLVAAGVYPSPVPYAHIVTTTTHKTLRGPRGAMIMVTDKGLKKDPDLGKKIEKAVFPGLQGGPHINTIAGIAVALKEASTNNFKKYANQIIKNAKVLAEELKKYDFHLVSGGTESHLILIDLTNKKVIGNLAAEALEAAGIVLNRNAVPFDPNPPFYPSGIRLGTPGVTSRGMKEQEMKKIAFWINEIITDISQIKKELKMTFEHEKKLENRKKIINKSKIIKKTKNEVKNLCRKFPVKKIY